MLSSCNNLQNLFKTRKIPEGLEKSKPHSPKQDISLLKDTRDLFVLYHFARKYLKG